MYEVARGKVSTRCAIVQSAISTNSMSSYMYSSVAISRGTSLRQPVLDTLKLIFAIVFTSSPPLPSPPQLVQGHEATPVLLGLPTPEGHTPRSWVLSNHGTLVVVGYEDGLLQVYM